MSRKTLLVLFSLTVLMFCSCEEEQNVGDKSLVPVVVNLSQDEKALTVPKVSEQAVSYQYKAQSTSSDAVGSTSDWTNLNVSNSTAELGSFSQGRWTFFIRSLDGNSSVLYEGSTSVYLSGTEPFVVNIFMTKKSNGGSGTVSIEVRCPSPDSSVYTLCAAYRKVGDSTYQEKTDFGSTKVGSEMVFTGELTLSEGSYEFDFTYFKDGVQAGGETVAVDVVGGRIQTLSGSITSRINQTSGLSINSGLSKQKIAVGESVDFVWQSNGKSKTYTWYVDNVEVLGCTTASFSFSNSSGGEYTVKCITSDGETASCTVRVCYPISVSFENLVNLCENADYICKGFKPKGESDDKMITSYKYSTLNSTTLSYTSLDDLGLEPVIVSGDGVLSADTIIIGKNVVATSSTSKNWFGQRTSTSRAGFTTVYIFKTPSVSCVSGINTLKNVYVMEGVTSIPDHSFYNCKTVTSFSLPSTLTSIGDCAFQACNALTQITIPKTVSTMGTQVFYNCSGLSRIYCDLTSQPSGWSATWKSGCTATGPF